MRSLTKRSIVTLAALAGVLGLSSAASALTIYMEWTGTGTNRPETPFTASEVVTLEIYAHVTVPPGLDMVVISVGWDSNALSLLSCTPANTTVAQYVAGDPDVESGNGGIRLLDSPAKLRQQRQAGVDLGPTQIEK